jgi:prepilin-type N-terminal cleavage/methylation domain-containing protein
MFRFKKNGFSIIELMIVVAIIGITAALAAPSYRAWIQNTKVRTAGESILNGIQKLCENVVKLSKITPSFSSIDQGKDKEEIIPIFDERTSRFLYEFYLLLLLIIHTSQFS